jgi:hypothetical protein
MCGRFTLRANAKEIARHFVPAEEGVNLLAVKKRLNMNEHISHRDDLCN